MRLPSQGAIHPLRRRPPKAAQYLMALASVAAATGIRWLLDPDLGEHLPFAVYFVSVAYSAWFTRVGPAIAALVTGGVIAHLLFVAPHHSSVLHPGGAPSQVGLALYLSVGTALIALCEVFRRARSRAEAREQEQRITISSIGDGVITTDARGHVCLLNPVAEELTGWTQEEARGRALEEVFRIVNEVTRETVRNPVATVLAEGTIAGLGSETILISRDGADRPIDDSAAPIRNDEGEIAGAVLIFRDIAARRRTERARFQLAAIVESADDAIIGNDRNGIITSWNRGAEALYGYAPQDAVGKSISMLIPPDRQEELRRFLDPLEGDEKIEYYETVHVRKGGDRVDVFVTISPIRDDAGQISGAASIARDITTRRRAEEALRESQGRNAAMINASLDGILTIDERSTIIEFNPAAEKIFGYARDEVLGREMTEVIIPERLRSSHRNGIAHYLATGESRVLDRHLELPALRRDGSEFLVELAITRITQRGPALFTGYVRDISERKRAEEHLKFLSQASELFASSLDFDTTMKNIVTLAVPALADWAVVDLATPDSDQPYRRLAVVHVDPAKADLAMELRRKYPPDEKTDRVLHAIRTGQSELVTEVTDDMLRAGSSSEEHFRMVREAGVVSSMIVPLRLRNVPIGAVTFVSSESKRRFTRSDLTHAEEFARRASLAFENSRLYSEAQQANRAKDNFLAVLSHELRTPMTSILGWSRMLADGQLDPKTQRMAVDAIQRGAEMQAALIEDVLDMSRIVSGKMRLDVQQCELTKIAEAALATVEPGASAKGITIDFEKHGAAIVTGDPARLQQVLWNLLTNAIKFTPRGGKIRVKTEERDSYAQVTVSDTGQGFAPEFGGHLFEPFRQAESAVTRSHGGLGLGLSIVRHLVEQHGGTVTAESAGAGQGATFRVRIPLRAVDTDERERDDRPMRLARDEPRPAPCSGETLEGLRVLFVDDQEDARSLFATILQRCGARVATAQSVDEAMERFKSERFDLVVTDIAMPGRDGFELIRWLRNQDDGNELRVIALTAFGGPDDRERVLAAGCDDYLKKPVEPASLIATIARVTRRQIELAPPADEES